MDRMIVLLDAMRGNDNTKRAEAEQLYEASRTAQPDSLIATMGLMLSKEGGQTSERRHQAAVLLRSLCAEGGKSGKFCYDKATEKTQLALKQHVLDIISAETDYSFCRVVIGVAAALADYFVCNGAGWPELLHAVFTLSKSADVNQRRTAAYAMSQLVTPFQESLISNITEVVQFLKSILNDADLKVRAQGVHLTSELVNHMDANEYKPLKEVIPPMFKAVKDAFVSNDSSIWQECGTAIVQMASQEPLFFKDPAFPEVVTLIYQMVLERSIDNDARAMGLEFLSTLAEEKPKMCLKVPNFAAMAIECCLVLMTTVDDDVEEWAGRMADEEGDEDEESACQVAEDAIDNIVKHLSFDKCSAALFECVTRFFAMEEWQAKYAALAAMKQTVEYIEVEHITHCAEVLLLAVSHAHPRVRHAALTGIAMLANDLNPEFQDSCHGQVVPALLQMIDDPVDRVSAMSMSAFVSFGEHLDNTIMGVYILPMMAKFEQKLHSPNRGVRQEALTAIAVVAGVMEQEFGQFYDSIMPTVKNIVTTATSEKEKVLRGKALECMSLLGLAVGKAKFAPDVALALNSMLKTPFVVEDVLKEYMNEVMERICKTLKSDFAQYLPMILPGVLSAVQLENLKSDNDEDCLVIETAEGKQIKVHTGKFQDILMNVQLCKAFVEGCGESFFVHIAETARALMPLLTSTDDASFLCAELRDETVKVWAELIKVAKGNPGGAAVAKELLDNLLAKVVPACMEENADSVGDLAMGIHDCLQAGGANCIDEHTTQVILHMVETKLKESFSNNENAVAKDLEDGDVVEDDAQSVPEFQTSREKLTNVFGALMVANQDAFFKHGATLAADLLKTWQASPSADNRVLGLCLACDFLEYLKEKSLDAWPMFMDFVLVSTRDESAAVRQAAAFAVNLAAAIPQFEAHAPTAFTNLVHVLNSVKQSRKEAVGMAADNAVAALLSLCITMPHAASGNIDQIWELVFSKLPLTVDDEEAMKVATKLYNMVEAGDARLLGPQNCRLGKVLGVLAESQSTELVEVGMKEKIGLMFAGMDKNVLMSVESQFTPKQHKKISKLINYAI